MASRQRGLKQFMAVAHYFFVNRCIIINNSEHTTSSLFMASVEFVEVHIYLAKRVSLVFCVYARREQREFITQ